MAPKSSIGIHQEFLIDYVIFLPVTARANWLNLETTLFLKYQHCFLSAGAKILVEAVDSLETGHIPSSPQIVAEIQRKDYN